MTATAVAPQPAWYADPGDPSRLRWWDGRCWTNTVRPAATSHTPPAGSIQPFTPDPVVWNGPSTARAAHQVTHSLRRAEFAPHRTDDFTSWDTYGSVVPDNLPDVNADPSDVQTRPEATLASWGARVSASLLDIALYGVGAVGAAIGAYEFASWAALLIVGDTSAGVTMQQTQLAAQAILAANLLGAVIAFAVFAVLPATHEGWSHRASLGKRAFGLLVVDDEGNPLTIGAALLRRVCAGLLAAIPIVGIAAALSPLFTRDGVAWHDRITRTRVVKPL